MHPDGNKKIQKMYANEKKRQQLMLKDYLRDDLSSCSSSGFKSFPRRQCCTTVRFLLEMDLKANNSINQKQALLKQHRSKSALQRASEAVLSAVKYLQFHSVTPLPSHSVSKSRGRRGIFRRSFSRKFLKRSFWKKADRDNGEIGRWRSFGEFLEEDNRPSDPNAAAVDATATTIIPTSASSSVSTSRSGNGKSNGNSWSESEFTADILPSCSCNSKSSSVTDSAEVKNSSPGTGVSDGMGATAGVDSVNCAKEWPSEEGKEQLSPVSVLDNPFEEEEENTSPSVQLEGGTKQKLMHKIRRFESVAWLEPVDLEKRLASSELEDESLRPLSVDGEHKSISSVGSKEETFTEAEDLLKLFKSKMPSNKLKLKADSVLLDFFRERIVQDGRGESEKETLKMAEEWFKGQSQELVLGWKVKEGRKALLKDTERNGTWKNLEEAKEEVAAEMELDMLTSLVEGFLIDQHSFYTN